MMFVVPRSSCDEDLVLGILLSLLFKHDMAVHDFSFTSLGKKQNW